MRKDIIGYYHCSLKLGIAKESNYATILHMEAIKAVAYFFLMNTICKTY
jgi:hypothetical protein